MSDGRSSSSQDVSERILYIGKPLAESIAPVVLPVLEAGADAPAGLPVSNEEIVEAAVVVVDADSSVPPDLIEIMH